MKYEKLARFIIKNVGGEKNINIVQHCATRLRFELKDEEKVNKVNLENSSEILQVLLVPMLLMYIKQSWQQLK